MRDSRNSIYYRRKEIKRPALSKITGQSKGIAGHLNPGGRGSL